MKRYFKNLLIALLARNPYREELARMTESYNEEKTRICDYQNLTENLRKRITEKDLAIDDVKSQLRKTIAARELKIAELREDLNATLKILQEAKSEIAANLVQH